MHKLGYALWPSLIAMKMVFILIGVWEIVAIMLYHQKMFVPAFVMLFMFMGGVFASITIISPKAFGAIIFALPTTVFLLYASNHNNTDSQHALYLIAAGYVIGFVVNAMSPKRKKEAKATD